MTVCLYMAITINGMIGKPDGNSDWVSQANIDDFYPFCDSCDAVIMGRKTYDLLYPNELPCKNGIQVVMRHKDNKTPQEVLKDLVKQGAEKVCVIGGQQIANLFIKENLINEIFLVIEPLAFGRGMQLFSPVDFEVKLKLLETKNLSDQTLRLHYKVLR